MHPLCLLPYWPLYPERMVIMEFNEKLQELRKQKGLTQEELAQQLFVSRAAVSKWESGRGYPNIESLKLIAKFFCVSVDTLLSGEAVLAIAQEESREQEARFLRCLFGLLDSSVLLFFLLPFFKEGVAGAMRAVALPALKEVSAYLKYCCWAVVLGESLWGILSLALRDRLETVRSYSISFLLNGAGVLLFIISQQPYAAAYLFLILVFKLIFYMKKQ